MRLFAVADIHGRFARIEHIRQQIDVYHPDVLIIAGDITRFFRPEPVLAKLGALTLPVLLVRGNTDQPRLQKRMERWPNLHLLHLSQKRLQQFNFVGVSGTIPIPFRSRVTLCERWESRVAPLIDQQTVFIAHPPPLRTLDTVSGTRHAGSSHILAFIQKYQPWLFICGHIHESSGVARLERTTVINCSMGRSGTGVMIDLQDKGTFVTHWV